MTRDEIIQRLQHLRKQIQFRHDRFMELAVAGEASLVTDAEDAAEHVAALDQALAELTAHASAAPSMSSAAVTDAHRRMAQLVRHLPEAVEDDAAAPSPAFRVGVNEADETDPHLRMRAAPSSPSVDQAIKAYTVARFRAETEAMRQAQGDDNADVVGCARGERDLKFDALIAAVRAENQRPVRLRGAPGTGGADRAREGVMEANSTTPVPHRPLDGVDHVTRVAARQRRRELLQLARWIEQHFRLGAQPKVHSATAEEVIYARVLRRISELTEVVDDA